MGETNDRRTWQYEPEENNMLANIGEYIDGRMIRFVCEFAEPPSAEDAALMIAAKNATSTPPADSELAEELDCVASELATYQSDNAATVSRAAAALRARQPAQAVAVPESLLSESADYLHHYGRGDIANELRALLAASKGGAE